MNELNLGKLQLRINVLKRRVEERDKPYLDWLDCDVMISLPTFNGHILWSVMPFELERLATDLSKMHAELSVPGEVIFKPVESNVVLSFELKRAGQILGHFAFRPDWGEDTLLSGAFNIDQSYLPDMVKSIRALLKSSVEQIEIIGRS